MLTYCVKQKKQTACLPGSKTFLVTKNGRNAMKCVCSECGATKFRFIKGPQNGEGLGDILGTFTGSLLKSETDQMEKFIILLHNINYIGYLVKVDKMETVF